MWKARRVYEITDTGRAFLDEHKDIVEDIFDLSWRKQMTRVLRETGPR